MPRCGCASDRCDCNFIAGDGVIIYGTGSRSNPYVVQAVVPTGGGGGTTETVARMVGEVTAYAGSTPPTGWLLCNGALVDRGAFPDLFAVIGTAYGAGDGVTTFKLPNFTGKVPLGASTTRPRGSSGGSDSHHLEVRHLPLHTHSMTHTHTINHDHGRTSDNGTHDHNLDFSEATGGSWSNVPEGTATKTGGSAQAIGDAGQHDHDLPAFNGNSGAASTSNTGPAGSTNPDSLDTMPPYQTVNYIIKT